MKITFLSLFLLLGLAGCSLFGEKEEVKADENWSVERIYAEANAALNIADYRTAIEYYEQLEARFPFGEYAQQALLESAYAHYKIDEPETALATIDRFMRVYPLNEKMDYALYLRGLISFNKDVGFLEKYIPRDESQRDPASAEDALADFNTLIARYPTSKYAEDATQRIVYLRNRLAQHEINVANYYMRRTSYLAAANRARYVLENYARTPAMPEALVIMAKAYKIMELDDLSADALSVLQLNYPGHPGIADVERTVLAD
ncbi:putative component of the lipoprotein assembly complex (forms a complex with YaeT, YfgL, and NlpB) [Methylophaga frappieri]|jgi:outer membrane protein assembly factor BamD|uniref:Outer membrane protein assembly factor BamD n=1 Tax=Methylophaga frappieri (strain ATCC BAA-2434 / DSM 25690 / JAM7) TaxID=754477 RepID=I1YFC2_METFJ|nr:outer membrane protein assembly factor BamD [Methylophaga frappieri]AFJ01615.1 putative component of the lipoprotein assembly complex (forms a complex with YaeT, YfgL, and NlpB) [Methylophaga frappieri]